MQLQGDAPSVGNAGRFEYRGWAVQIELDRSNDCFAGHADLHFRGEHKCRVVLATSAGDAATARSTLDSKARDYIDDWFDRSHRGDTTLQAL